MTSNKTGFLVILFILIAFAVTYVENAFARPMLTVDLHSGEVVFAQDEKELWHPASIAKLMTAQIAFRAVQSGLLSLQTPVIISANAASMPPSKAGFKRGTTIPLNEALTILLTRSANDLAVAVAETIAGSESRFALLMNKEAKSLGMHGSNFKNASGLHASGQVSTAQDIAILVRHIVLTYPQYMSMFSYPEYIYKNKTFKNTNGLVRSYRGAIGMKTGYVCAAGYNLVAVATRNGHTFISVVLGEGSTGKREAAVAKLLDNAFASKSGNFSELKYRLKSTPNLKRKAVDMTSKNCGRGWNGVLLRQREAFDVVVPVPVPRPKKWGHFGSLENYSG